MIPSSLDLDLYTSIARTRLNLEKPGTVSDSPCEMRNEDEMRKGSFKRLENETGCALPGRPIVASTFVARGRTIS